MDAIRADALGRRDVEVVDAPSFYTLDTFNTCAREGFLMETLDAWEGVHPGMVTLPMSWDYAVPYGIVYAKGAPQHVAQSRAPAMANRKKSVEVRVSLDLFQKSDNRAFGVRRMTRCRNMTQIIEFSFVNGSACGIL